MKANFALCDCFMDRTFSVVKELYSPLTVGKLENPDAYGYPEVVYIPLELKLNYCPQCGKKIRSEWQEILYNQEEKDIDRTVNYLKDKFINK